MSEVKRRVYVTWFWRIMVWYVQLFKSKSDNIQVGANYYGGSLTIAFYFDSPTERQVVAATSMTFAQSRCFHAEVGRQIERFEAFAPSQT